MSKNISNSLESVFAEHEFSNSLQLLAFSGQAEGLSQTLKQPAQKLFALLAYRPLCSGMVIKKITCFEGCRNKTHQGNEREQRVEKTSQTYLPTCAEKLPTRLGKDRMKGFI